MSLSKWMMKNGKKAFKGGMKAVDELTNSKTVTDSLDKVKKGVGKIAKGIKDSDVAANVSEGVGKAGKAAEKYIKKNPKKSLVGAGAAGAAAGSAAAIVSDDDGDADDMRYKKKKKRPYMEDV